MKRLHVSVAVGDVAQSVKFYSSLFGAEPTVAKPDYAKWMLDDPRVNFSIVPGGAKTGVHHLGIQAESGEELETVLERFASADTATVAQPSATCCYAKSDKGWAQDPQGIKWEAFHTYGENATFGRDRSPGNAPVAEAKAVKAGGCCGASA